MRAPPAVLVERVDVLEELGVEVLRAAGQAVEGRVEALAGDRPVASQQCLDAAPLSRIGAVRVVIRVLTAILTSGLVGSPAALTCARTSSASRPKSVPTLPVQPRRASS